MKTINIRKVVKFAVNAGKKHSPELLTGLAIAGGITSTILAVKATPKAMRLLEEAKDKKKSELTKTEALKATYKVYIPAVLTGLCSAGCMIGATSVSTKRTAAIATAYQISQTALRDYKEKVLETIGEKKEHAIRDEVAKTKLEQHPVGKSEIIVTGGGDTLCLDTISGRYFKSNIEKIKRAENELNRQLVYDMYVSLNDFYDAIGLSQTKQGDILGWNLDEGLLELFFSSQLNENDEPCLVIDYTIAPRYDFAKLG